ncbi:MAG TPA: VanZ family protein, partial [Chromatiaceae bacterium]|nr:VanZ family protein [Chromatiaceae bacterium]
TNLLIYMPLGFLLMRGLPVSRHCHWRRWLMTLLLGALLSLVLEYLQAYLPGRTPSARDLLLNGVGTGIGALLAQLVTSGNRFQQRFRVLRATYILPGARADIGLLTLGFWALAQLAPLVPSLDLDNIHHGLKPLFLFLRYPSRFSWLQWGEYVTALTALGLLYAGLQRYRYLAISRFLSLAATVLLLKILVVSRQLSAEALLGLAAAAPLLLVMARTRAPSKSLMAIVLIVSAMLLETIQPNPGITTTTAINWIPFRGHLNNDVTGILDILGEAWPVLGLAYLSMRQFGTSRAVLLNGMLCVFFGTFAMEWMQRAIPGRSADITDVLVSTLAWLFAWIYVSTKNPTGLSASKPTGNGGDPLFKSHPTLLKVGLPALVATASVGIVGSFWLQETTTRATAPSLEHLPPNRWIRLHQPKRSSWRRQNHAGIAYDSRRHSLLLFGSDTHRSNWDNSVHEFDIQTLTWKTHYPEAPPETYRVDSRGQPVAGGDRPLPWAMHTFDTVVYDPQQDALVVAARPLHNPMIKKVEGIRQHPT